MCIQKGSRHTVEERFFHENDNPKSTPYRAEKISLARKTDDITWPRDREREREREKVGTFDERDAYTLYRKSSGAGRREVEAA